MLVAYENKTPDVTLKHQIYPNCNLNAPKIKESTESLQNHSHKKISIFFPTGSQSSLEQKVF